MNNGKMLIELAEFSEKLQKYRQILERLKSEQEANKIKRERLSKLSQRRCSDNKKPNVTCCMCNTNIKIEDSNSFATCRGCERLVCRNEEKRCCEWISAIGIWECTSCRSSRVIQQKAGEWLLNQLTRRLQNPGPINLTNENLLGLSVTDSDDGQSSTSSISSSQKVKVREFIEELLSTMLNGPLDDVSVGQLMKNESYLPICENQKYPDSPSDQHFQLRKLLQRILDEVVKLPELLNQSGHPLRPEEHLPYFSPKKYEQLLATAVLNKVVEDYRNPKNFERVEKQPEVKPADSAAAAGTTFDINHNKVPGKSLLNEDNLRQMSLNANPKEAHSSSSLSESDESYLSDYIQKHTVPLPDLSDTTGSGPEDDLISLKSNTTDGTWEENWLFKKRKLKTTESAIAMLVPSPTEEVKALIGDKNADEVSDLSEAGSDLEDYDSESNSKDLNLSSKSSAPNTGTTNEDAIQDSLVSINSIPSNEPVLSEAKNSLLLAEQAAQELNDSGLVHDLISMEPIVVQAEAANSRLLDERQDQLVDESELMNNNILKADEVETDDVKLMQERLQNAPKQRDIEGNVLYPVAVARTIAPSDGQTTECDRKEIPIDREEEQEPFRSLTSTRWILSPADSFATADENEYRSLSQVDSEATSTAGLDTDTSLVQSLGSLESSTSFENSRYYQEEGLSSIQRGHDPTQSEPVLFDSLENASLEATTAPSPDSLQLTAGTEHVVFWAEVHAETDLNANEIIPTESTVCSSEKNQLEGEYQVSAALKVIDCNVASESEECSQRVVKCNQEDRTDGTRFQEVCVPGSFPAEALDTKTRILKEINIQGVSEELPTSIEEKVQPSPAGEKASESPEFFDADSFDPEKSSTLTEQLIDVAQQHPVAQEVPGSVLSTQLLETETHALVDQQNQPDSAESSISTESQKNTASLEVGEAGRQGLGEVALDNQRTSVSQEVCGSHTSSELLETEILQVSAEKIDLRNQTISQTPSLSNEQIVDAAKTLPASQDAQESDSSPQLLEVDQPLSSEIRTLVVSEAFEELSSSGDQIVDAVQQQPMDASSESDKSSELLSSGNQSLLETVTLLTDPKSAIVSKESASVVVQTVQQQTPSQETPGTDSSVLEVDKPLTSEIIASTDPKTLEETSSSKEAVVDFYPKLLESDKVSENQPLVEVTTLTDQQSQSASSVEQIVDAEQQHTASPESLEVDSPTNLLEVDKPQTSEISEESVKEQVVDTSAKVLESVKASELLASENQSLVEATTLKDQLNEVTSDKSISSVKEIVEDIASEETLGAGSPVQLLEVDKPLTSEMHAEPKTVEEAPSSKEQVFDSSPKVLESDDASELRTSDNQLLVVKATLIDQLNEVVSDKSISTVEDSPTNLLEMDKPQTSELPTLAHPETLEETLSSKEQVIDSSPKLIESDKTTELITSDEATPLIDQISEVVSDKPASSAEETINATQQHPASEEIPENRPSVETPTLLDPKVEVVSAMSISAVEEKNDAAQQHSVSKGPLGADSPIKLLEMDKLQTSEAHTLDEQKTFEETSSSEEQIAQETCGIDTSAEILQPIRTSENQSLVVTTAMTDLQSKAISEETFSDKHENDPAQKRSPEASGVDSSIKSLQVDPVSQEVKESSTELLEFDKTSENQPLVEASSVEQIVDAVQQEIISQEESGADSLTKLSEVEKSLISEVNALAEPENFDETTSSNVQIIDDEQKHPTSQELIVSSTSSELLESDKASKPVTSESQPLVGADSSAEIIEMEKLATSVSLEPATAEKTSSLSEQIVVATQQEINASDSSSELLESDRTSELQPLVEAKTLLNPKNEAIVVSSVEQIADAGKQEIASQKESGSDSPIKSSKVDEPITSEVDALAEPENFEETSTSRDPIADDGSHEPKSSIELLESDKASELVTSEKQTLAGATALTDQQNEVISNKLASSVKQIIDTAQQEIASKEATGSDSPTKLSAVEKSLSFEDNKPTISEKAPSSREQIVDTAQQNSASQEVQKDSSPVLLESDRSSELHTTENQHIVEAVTLPDQNNKASSVEQKVDAAEQEIASQEESGAGSPTKLVCESNSSPELLESDRSSENQPLVETSTLTNEQRETISNETICSAVQETDSAQHHSTSQEACGADPAAKLSEVDKLLTAVEPATCAETSGEHPASQEVNESDSSPKLLESDRSSELQTPEHQPLIEAVTLLESKTEAIADETASSVEQIVDAAQRETANHEISGTDSPSILSEADKPLTSEVNALTEPEIFGKIVDGGQKHPTSQELNVSNSSPDLLESVQVSELVTSENETLVGATALTDQQNEVIPNKLASSVEQIIDTAQQEVVSQGASKVDFPTKLSEVDKSHSSEDNKPTISEETPYTEPIVDTAQQHSASHEVNESGSSPELLESDKTSNLAISETQSLVEAKTLIDSNNEASSAESTSSVEQIIDMAQKEVAGQEASTVDSTTKLSEVERPLTSEEIASSSEQIIDDGLKHPASQEPNLSNSSLELLESDEASKPLATENQSLVEATTLIDHQNELIQNKVASSVIDTSQQEVASQEPSQADSPTELLEGEKLATSDIHVSLEPETFKETSSPREQIVDTTQQCPASQEVNESGSLPELPESDRTSENQSLVEGTDSSVKQIVDAAQQEITNQKESGVDSPTKLSKVERSLTSEVNALAEPDIFEETSPSSEQIIDDGKKPPTSQELDLSKSSSELLESDKASEPLASDNQFAVEAITLTDQQNKAIVDEIASSDVRIVDTAQQEIVSPKTSAADSPTKLSEVEKPLASEVHEPQSFEETPSSEEQTIDAGHKQPASQELTESDSSPELLESVIPPELLTSENQPSAITLTEKNEATCSIEQKIDAAQQEMDKPLITEMHTSAQPEIIEETSSSSVQIIDVVQQEEIDSNSASELLESDKPCEVQSSENQPSIETATQAISDESSAMPIDNVTQQHPASQETSAAELTEVNKTSEQSPCFREQIIDAAQQELSASASSPELSDSNTLSNSENQPTAGAATLLDQQNETISDESSFSVTPKIDAAQEHSVIFDAPGTSPSPSLVEETGKSSAAASEVEIQTTSTEQTVETAPQPSKSQQSDENNADSEQQIDDEEMPIINSSIVGQGKESLSLWISEESASLDEASVEYTVDNLADLSEIEAESLTRPTDSTLHSPAFDLTESSSPEDTSTEAIAGSIDRASSPEELDPMMASAIPISVVTQQMRKYCEELKGILHPQAHSPQVIENPSNETALPEEAIEATELLMPLEAFQLKTAEYNQNLRYIDYVEEDTPAVEDISCMAMAIQAASCEVVKVIPSAEEYSVNEALLVEMTATPEPISAQTYERQITATVEELKSDQNSPEALSNIEPYQNDPNVVEVEATQTQTPDHISHFEHVESAEQLDDQTPPSSYQVEASEIPSKDSSIETRERELSSFSPEQQIDEISAPFNQSDSELSSLSFSMPTVCVLINSNTTNIPPADTNTASDLHDQPQSFVSETSLQIVDQDLPESPQLSAQPSELKNGHDSNGHERFVDGQNDEGLIPGSIAEREHLKWRNASPIANNPYSPDVLQKRLSDSNQRSNFADFDRLASKDLSTATLDSSPATEVASNDNEASCGEKDRSLQSVVGGSPTPYTRYGRDYYINDAKRASGSRKQASSVPAPTHSTDDEKSLFLSQTQDQREDERLSPISGMTSPSYEPLTPVKKIVNIFHSEEPVEATTARKNSKLDGQITAIEEPITPQSGGSFSELSMNSRADESLTFSEDSDITRIYEIGTGETKLIHGQAPAPPNIAPPSNGQHLENEVLSEEILEIMPQISSPNETEPETTPERRLSSPTIDRSNLIKPRYVKMKQLSPETIRFFSPKKPFSPGGSNLTSTSPLSKSATDFTDLTLQHANQYHSTLHIDFPGTRSVASHEFTIEKEVMEVLPSVRELAKCYIKPTVSEVPKPILRPRDFIRHSSYVINEESQSESQNGVPIVQDKNQRMYQSTSSISAAEEIREIRRLNLEAYNQQIFVPMAPGHSITARSLSKQIRDELKTNATDDHKVHGGHASPERPSSPVFEPGHLRSSIQFFENLRNK